MPRWPDELLVFLAIVLPLTMLAGWLLGCRAGTRRPIGRERGAMASRAFGLLSYLPFAAVLVFAVMVLHAWIEHGRFPRPASAGFPDGTPRPPNLHLAKSTL